MIVSMQLVALNFTTVPSWVIPLLALSVIIWVLCLIEGVISIPISIILDCKVSKNENSKLKLPVLLNVIRISYGGGGGGGGRGIRANLMIKHHPF